MRSVSSGSGSSKDRDGSRSGARSGRPRKVRPRTTALEGLEARLLLSVLPPTSVSNANQVVISPGFIGDTQNDSTPSIAIDPNNPQYMAAAWTINDPNRAPGPTELVEAAVSTDGGQNWGRINVGQQKLDPSTLGGTPALYAQGTDATVAFDRNDNLYLLYYQHNSGGTVGELLLTKYNFANGAATSVFRNNSILLDDGPTVYSPTLAVDSGVESFSQGGKTQNDPSSGNVYVAYHAVIPPVAPSTLTTSGLYLLASSDGGNTFNSAPVLVPGSDGIVGSNDGLVGTSPRLAVSQGTIQGNTSRTVAPGTVAVVWDDFNQNSGLTVNSTEPLMANSFTPATVQVVSPVESLPQPLNDAGPGVNNGPNSPATTDFHFNVSLPSGFSLTDLSVKLGLTHAADAELKIVLIPPNGSGLSPVVLINNNTDAAGNTTAQGVTGTNIGIGTNGVAPGEVFGDDGSFLAPGAAIPLGFVRPQGGRLDSAAYTSASAAKLSGTWTLEFTDFRNTNVGLLQFASLSFTSGLVAASQFGSRIADTPARGSLSGVTGSIASPSDPKGIGPDVSAAFDNTLGVYSPYQGRLYATYVTQEFIGDPASPFNQLDNSDIGLSYSDDGGLTWSTLSDKVNDDNGRTDGFSGAAVDSVLEPGTANHGSTVGRPQFMPSVSVDNATGTLVMSWFDGRNDPAHARVAVYMTTSIDGGDSFSQDVMASEAQQATDAITGNAVVLGPVPENQSGGNAEGVAAYGTRLGLAAYGGKAYPVWVGNENAATINSSRFSLQVQTAVASYATGPSVISSTMGPVNGSRAPDGTPVAATFQVVFDRPVPVADFTAANVTVTYRDTTANDAGGHNVPLLGNPVPLNQANGMATTYLVTFQPSISVGTYSYSVHGVSDGIEAVTAAGTSSGNVGPTYSVPDGPGSLPLIVSGPTVTGSDAQNATNNLALNNKVSYVDVTFDRNMAGPGTPGTLTPDKVLSVVGPAGSILQPQTFASTQVGQAVPDGTDSLVSKLVIPSYEGTFPIANLLVTLNLSSTRDGDLAVYLIGPDGTTTVRLTNNTGGTGGGFVGTVFADQASQSITQGSAPFNGVYRPVDPLGNFAGKQLQGTWSLVVKDATKNGSVSVLNGWSLVATPSVTVTPNPTAGANPDPAHPRSFRVGFPEQSLSGTYTVTIASSVTDANGNALDTNQNAGVDLLNGTVTGGPVATIKYASTDVPKALSNGKVATSVINVPDNYRAQSVTLQLDVTHPSDPDLQIVLIPPPTAVDSQGHAIAPITLVAAGTGVSSNSEANFSGTLFDESAVTLIDTSKAPFFGSFKPHAALDVLSQNGGVLVGGAWTLQITDKATGSTPASGTLNSWSLNFGKGVPSSGLGEPVADQATVSFRIFTLDPADPQSQTTWTPVGPTTVDGVGALNGIAGRVSAIALDPSDASDNTAYVGGASGGVWRTTNFLTTDPAGPSYVSLTDFGPTFAMNIGSISVLGRNNDPRQSIIVAGTGESDSTYGYGGNTSQGVGFLLSTDGGTTWGLLDSTDNTLPFAQRDHLFAAGGGTSTAKVLVDPHLEPNGQVIIYAAMVGPNGGLWRSVDTGQTWQKLSSAAQGSATDVILDTTSATVNALTNPTGNVNTIYASFPGSGVYVSPNRGNVLNLLNSLPNVPQIVDTAFVNNPPVINNTVVSPTGAAGGRIVLAKPAPVAGATLANVLYEGWLYAAVATPTGTLDGVYMTKDFGQTWTKLRLPNLPYDLTPLVVDPTNDTTQPNVDPTSSNVFQHGNYDLALTVDSQNPNVVYLGGTQNGRANSGMIRIDATTVFDTHAVVAYDSSRPDGGQTLYSTVGRMVPDPDFLSYPITGFINVVFNPGNPFVTGSAYGQRGIHAETNDGSGVKWTPFNSILDGATNLHLALSVIDPQTGRARLIFGTDDGVYSGVVAPDGSLVTNVGGTAVPIGARNGNLQIVQDYSGAAQPTTSVPAQVAALIYGNTQSLGETSTSLGVVGTGQIAGLGNSRGEADGTGIATDQQGRGIVYRYMWPASNADPDGGFGLVNQAFFQVSTSGDTGFVGHTSGLIQGNQAAQWPGATQTYANGTIQFGKFAVNPVDGDQVIIGDATGQIFSTINQGVSWLSIGQPEPGAYADALAYGAPDPGAPGGIGNLNNFLYAGTVTGHIYVTRTGGNGGAGNIWTDISGGLDGSAVVKIVPSPARGSHATYAVTEKGVYYTSDSITNSGWSNISGNLFSITTTAFGDPSTAQPRLQYLTSMQADWRYAIANATGTGTHPALYVGGEGGVFRSSDNGATWELYPGTADGAAVAGGNLPNAHVTDLSLSIGPINPTSGYSVADAGTPDLLIASTFGRGQFAIVVGPDVFPATVELDPSLPAPKGSNGGIDPKTGLPIASSATPYITGVSEATAFGNTVRITLLDLTDPSNPTVIGGYNPSDPSTDVLANWTNQVGQFHVQINAGAFTSGGVKTIGVQATDLSGISGNVAAFQFVINGKIQPPHQPPDVPTLTMNPADDSSGGSFFTNDTTPQLIGNTSANVTVQLYRSDGTNPILTSPFGPAVTSDDLGNFSVQPSSPLIAGKYVVQARATNQFGSTNGLPFTFHISVGGPPTKPTLSLSALDDTGITGDRITAARTPHFVGHADPNVVVALYRVVNGVPQTDPADVLASTISDASGNYSLQLPYNLFDGTISVEVGVTDQSGTAGQFSDALPPITIVTVPGDYVGPVASTAATPASSRTTPALFRRAPGGAAEWLIQGVSPPGGLAFGGSNDDIPFAGDFDGDGKADLAVYRPATGAWYIRRSSYGFETFTLGGPGTVPAAGVFAPDGLTDPASYNPTTGQWSVLTAAGMESVTFNSPVFTPQPGDVPVPGDYTGNPNGIDQFAVYRPSTGTFFVRMGSGADPDAVFFFSLGTGTAGDIPVPGHYNDGVGLYQTDAAVYNPATGVWKVHTGSGDQVFQFQPNDIPAPGDYTGSGKTQEVVYRPGASAFISATGTTLATIGRPGDIPVTAPLAYRGVVGSTLNPALYVDPRSDSGLAGDNVTIARRPFVDGWTNPNAAIDVIALGGGVVGAGASDALGNYQIEISAGADLPNGTYTFLAIARGTEARPVLMGPALTVKIATTSGDYAGTGVTQVALFRRTGPFSAQWFVQGAPAVNATSFGAGGLDVPVAANFDGSGKASLALFRPSTGQWFDDTAANNGHGKLLTTWGQAGDIPVPGDYAGTGVDAPAVYRPSTGQFFAFALGPNPVVVTGPQPGDVPVPGNYDNTGRTEFAVYRPSANGSTWFILGPNGVRTVKFGGPDDIPVPGAYDATAANHATGPAVWRPSTGQYFILGPNGGRMLRFNPGDIPMPGDYDGFGVTEAAVYRPGNPGVILVWGPNDTAPRALTAFGGATDIPVLAPYAYRALSPNPVYAPAYVPPGLGVAVPTGIATRAALAPAAAGQGQPSSLDFGATARTLAAGPASVASQTSRARPPQAVAKSPAVAPSVRLLPNQEFDKTNQG
jgi:subtilisin-like proprotein convertase family protein